MVRQKSNPFLMSSALKSTFFPHIVCYVLKLNKICNVTRTNKLFSVLFFLIVFFNSIPFCIY